MGQGNIAFTVGVQSIGKNQERGLFAIDEGGVFFLQCDEWCARISGVSGGYFGCVQCLVDR
jgi:hypothetical protein